jgi:hypothetical protein
MDTQLQRAYVPTVPPIEDVLFEHDLVEHDLRANAFGVCREENRYPPCAHAALRVQIMLLNYSEQ